LEKQNPSPQQQKKCTKRNEAEEEAKDELREEPRVQNKYIVVITIRWSPILLVLLLLS